MAIAAVGVATLSPEGIAYAQSPAAGVAARCMALPQEGGRQYPIIVAANQIGDLRNKGFRPIPCEEGFPNRASFELYRDRICYLNSILDEDMQEKFALAQGERPAVLCEMAEGYVGRWDRTRHRLEQRGAQ